MLKAIFWDNDGVLVDTEKYYFLATVETIAAAGVPISKEEFIEFSLKESKGVWHLAIRKGLDPDLLPELKQKRNERYHFYIRTKDILFPGVENTLENLSKNYRMAIITTSKKADFMAIHERTGYLNYFERWFALGDYENSKPAPDPYLTALNKMKLTAQQTIAVEDTQRGLISADAAGLRCIVIPTELSRRQDFSNAVAVLSSVSELPALLQSLGEKS